MTLAELPPLSQLGDPAVITNPYPVLAAIREASPYAAVGGSLIVLGRHADCSAILRDPQVSSERNRSMRAPPNAPRGGALSFLSMDPPDHTRLRRLVSKAFTPRVIARLAPRIREVTGELLSAAAARDPNELELVSQLAYPLPVRIISELLGVPAGDHRRFAAWSARLAHSLQPRFIAEDDAAYADAAEARAEFSGYFRDLIARRRADPADDLLTELIRAEDEGSRLTEAELLSTCILLLVAGHETTVGLISNAVLALLHHPEQLAALRADPALADGAVDETLRYDPPVQLTARIARGQMRIGGLDVPDGAVILILLAATGRDPDVFPDPDRFDITRGAGGHLAFAAGPHFCLGAPLARLEAAIALNAFATRVTAPELAEDGLSYKPNVNLRGPERLVVRTAGIRRPAT
ncbi:MAG TPA: cytochrome P450 [Streptosporangiaceae bacterium]|nr:cytochrome P450 [Streptosporangiaceae bacterium]